jgi:hypothetical protein
MKFETNSNDQNLNDQNKNGSSNYFGAFVLKKGARRNFSLQV